MDKEVSNQSDLRLDSTSDTPEQIQEALIKPNRPDPEETLEPAVLETAEEKEEKEDETSETPPEKEEVETKPKEPEALETAEEKTELKPQKSKGQIRTEKRIKGLLSRTHDAETAQRQAIARAEAAERLLLKRETPEEPGEPELETETTVDEPAGKPVYEDFDTHEGWSEAVMDWKIKSGKEAEVASAVEADNRARSSEFLDTWNEKEQTFMVAHEDYAEVIKGAIPELVEVQGIIMGSEVGPEVAYYLGQNPEEFKRINALAPFAAAREIGKIETQFTPSKPGGKAPPKKPVSKAPEPITPLGAGDTPTSKPMDEMGFQDFKAAREKQIAARAGR